MIIIKDKFKLNDLKSKSLGFVPTMGALHEGHFSLIRKSIEQNEKTIVSIYVNPTQFLPGEDLDAYPRNEEADLAACEALGVDAVFLPQDIYLENEPLILAPKSIASVLEGASRPGHFDGVLRVVNKLLNLVRPTRAYFGKKDAQQLFLVQNMVKSFFLPTQIIPCEIVRADDGLALSSRNVYLSEAERCEALKLSKSLKLALALVEDGCEDLGVIKAKMSEVLNGLRLDYLAFMDEDFTPASNAKGKLIILIAAFFSKCRLLDNVWIKHG